MKQQTLELENLRREVQEMWSLVNLQLIKSEQALWNHDPEIARDVMAREPRIDARELRLDSLTENFLALFHPVAVDLRMTLAIMKMATNLERIGDFADGIARFVVKSQAVASSGDLLNKLQLQVMFAVVRDMLERIHTALDKEDAQVAGSVLVMDDMLDDINRGATRIIADFIVENPQDAIYALHLYSISHKLERIGDHCNNIAEEIIFFIEAKVLKHSMNQEEENALVL